jgi:hypothetical protein
VYEGRMTWRRRVAGDLARAIWLGDAPGGNYTEQINDLARRAGSLLSVEVAHDDWCALLREVGPCNCNPEIRTRS